MRFLHFAGRAADERKLKLWQAGVITCVATAATLALRLAFDGPLGGRPPLVIFTMPNLLSAYLGEWRAGFLVTALSYFGVSYYWLAYVVVGGIGDRQPDHGAASPELEVSLRGELRRFNLEFGTSLRLRIGISTGPVIAGVIGRKKFAYDIWRETVNLACWLESTAKAGKIHVSETTWERLKTNYQFVRRQIMGVRRTNQPRSYWLGDAVDEPVVTSPP